LSDAGYAALGAEAVTQRASMLHKTTVYRRWPGRESLAVDALTDHVAAEVPVLDTGSVDALRTAGYRPCGVPELGLGP
jgi:AcrR family transcriptional regulator